MAEKRMFAKTIVLSDDFLDMPLGARCLYMTMNMMADDDGFVNNAKSIIRMAGATEDDLKVLVAKRYIIPFDDGVIVIRHWRINNYLRSDRYHDTKFLEHKAMLLLMENGEYELKDDVGIPNIGIPSIDKNRLDKISVDKSRVEEATPTDDEIIDSIKSAFNSQSNIAAKIQVIPPLNRRWNNVMLCVKQYGFDTVLNAIRHLDDNEFFQTWKPSFDWVVDPNNMIKIIEGNYKHNDKQTGDASKEWLEKWVAEDED